MQHPHPIDLASLKQLTAQIDRKQSAIRLGEKAHAALLVLLKHPQNTALLSITELAQQLNVNPSTLTRLAKRLGFSGFAEFQRLFRDSLSPVSPTFYSHQARRHLQQWSHSHHPDTFTQDSTRQRLQQLVSENISNIQQSLHNLHTEHFVSAAHAIAYAKRVRIHGVRQYSALAQFMSYGLSLIRNDVARLEENSLGLAEGLAQLEAGDVLISVSVTPYTQEVLSTHALAQHEQLTTISLTDNTASPLALHADFSFLFPTAVVFLAIVLVLILFLLKPY